MPHTDKKVILVQCKIASLVRKIIHVSFTHILYLTPLMNISGSAPACKYPVSTFIYLLLLLVSPVNNLHVPVHVHVHTYPLPLSFVIHGYTLAVLSELVVLRIVSNPKPTYQVLAYGTPLLSSTVDEFQALENDPEYQRMTQQVIVLMNCVRT